ncbi:hypothetical protein M3Y99_00849500 [Aphelenchoides fujianensis]|nr:hypothetical protein M3Y99_00849500 [Aphelenchoides fujianensis]
MKSLVFVALSAFAFAIFCEAAAIVGKATAPAGTTTAPYIPCGDSQARQINIFIDDSNYWLDAPKWAILKKFLGKKMFVGWTHFERLGLHYCDAPGCIWRTPGYFFNYDDVTRTVNNADQFSYDASIGSNIQQYVQQQLPDELDMPQAYVYFTTVVRQADLDLLKQWVPVLNGDLTIVAMNTANQTLLQQTTYSIIDWADFTQSEPPCWPPMAAPRKQ